VTTIIPEQIYLKSDGFVSRIVAGEAILVPLRKNVGDLDHIFSLNETGVAIWNLLDGQRNLREVLRIFLVDFDVDEAEATRDLLELMDDLLKIGAVNQVA